LAAPFCFSGEKKMVQTFEWVQPIGGKKITWRPLTMGDHLNLDALYRGTTDYQKPYALMAARITRLDDKTDVSLKDIYDWDEYDFISFREEVESRELARMVALAPQRPGGVVTTLEQAVNEAQVALGKIAQAISTVLERAKEAEQKLGPLR
jgi:hypothetical protein